MTVVAVAVTLFLSKKSKSLKNIKKDIDKSQKVNYYIVKVERTKGQREVNLRYTTY